MEELKNFYLKYKWYILTYIVYVIIVFAWVVDTYNPYYGEYDKTTLGIHLLFEVAVPIMLYLTISYFKHKKEIDESLQPNPLFSISLPFVDFIKKYGPTVKLVAHVNSSTSAAFHTIEVITSSGKSVSIMFHPSLGAELSPEELRDRKDTLFVGKKAEDNRWYLYDEKIGKGLWQDVDLGL